MKYDKDRIRQAIEVAVVVDNYLLRSGGESFLTDLSQGLVSFVEGLAHPALALEAINLASASVALTAGPVPGDVNPVARFLIGAHAIYDLLCLAGSDEGTGLSDDEKRVCGLLGISEEDFSRTAEERRRHAQIDGQGGV
jgi:hypothetical protein